MHANKDSQHPRLHDSFVETIILLRNDPLYSCDGDGDDDDCDGAGCCDDAFVYRMSASHEMILTF